MKALSALLAALALCAGLTIPAFAAGEPVTVPGNDLLHVTSPSTGVTAYTDAVGNLFTVYIFPPGTVFTPGGPSPEGTIIQTVGNLTEDVTGWSYEYTSFTLPATGVFGVTAVDYWNERNLTSYVTAAPRPPLTAHAATETLILDGEVIALEVYALLDSQGYSTNFVRLRDWAHLLSGTEAQFDAFWDGGSNAMRITTGAPYTPDGSEFGVPFSGDRPCTVPHASLTIDGFPASLSAIYLTDDAGGGYTYFKLRDLARALDFDIRWDDAARVIRVNTSQPYDQAAS